MKVTTRRSVIFQENWTLVRSGVTNHIEDAIAQVGYAPESVVFENTLRGFLGGCLEPGIRARGGGRHGIRDDGKPDSSRSQPSSILPIGLRHTCEFRMQGSSRRERTEPHKSLPFPIPHIILQPLERDHQTEANKENQIPHDHGRVV